MKRNIFYKNIAYALFRFNMGINMLMHSIVRIGPDRTPKFIKHMTGMFEGTVLPQTLVAYYSYGIIAAEILIGISLICGFKTLWGGSLGLILMSTFIFGASILEKWGLMANQLIYVIAFFIIVFFMDYNRYSIDDRGKYYGKI